MAGQAHGIHEHGWVNTLLDPVLSASVVRLVQRLCTNLPGELLINYALSGFLQQKLQIVYDGIEGLIWIFIAGPPSGRRCLFQDTP